MTDPAPPRPVPGPPRPLSGPLGRPAPVAGTPTAPAAGSPAGNPFRDLADRPVADSVAVYEAEHERLQRELSTIDQL